MSKNLGLSLPGIYRIINLVNQKVYVGQAIHIRKRWGAHRYALNRNVHRNRHLQNAWNKYGPPSFSFEVIEDFAYMAGQEMYAALDQAEINWLMHYKDNSYNLMMAVSHGIKATPEVSMWFSQHHANLWADEEHRARRTAAIVASYNEGDLRDRRRESLTTYARLSTTRAALSKRSVEMWKDPKHHQTQSERRKANWRDPQYVANQRASRVASWADEQKRANRLEGLRRAAKDPEVLRKRKESAAKARAKKKARGETTSWTDEQKINHKVATKRGAAKRKERPNNAEECRASTLKGWETRRKNQAAKNIDDASPLLVLDEA